MSWNDEGRTPLAVCFCAFLVGTIIAFASPRLAWSAPPQKHIHSGALEAIIDPEPFRFAFSFGDRQVLQADKTAGLLLDRHAAAISDETCSQEQCRMTVKTDSGLAAQVEIEVAAHRATLRVTPRFPGTRVEFQTGGAAPAYGLGDHSIAYHRNDTDVTGVSDEHFLADGGLTRLVSNFLIYPRQGLGVVLIEPAEKIVKSSADQIVMGAVKPQKETVIHYFFGSPHEIYAEYLAVRNQSGYPVFTPKYALFGVGWEAFGALGWDTNQKTVQESVERYRSLGYPLQWVAIGSGFWPAEKSFHETTSFGMFNKEKYPDPAALFTHFHGEGLKVLLGLRICFITDGPYAAEGVKDGYFLSKADGKPEVFTGDWPESPFYLLDAHNPSALKWYLGLVKKWTDYGVDGFKEDLYGYRTHELRDDKVNPINDVLMRQGVYLVERTGYLSSNGDLERINDFNYDQNQDRGPVNSLALAYSGLPLVYPDTIGGTFAENHFVTTRTPRMETYMMRNAMWVALHCGMSVGEPPWSFKNAQVGETMLKAAQLHGRLQPYLYSQAVRFAQDGYPWTMTPLPIAFPDDPGVYGRENDRVRGYAWLIGDALLATPVYGDDYQTATARDIYLPRGTWLDYDSGQKYEGPAVLKNFAMPMEKTPLFVGGSGIVVEEVESRTVARVYTVARNSSTVYWFPDAKSSATLSASVKDWAHPRTMDTTTHREVKGEWVRHAWQFPIAEGHSYRVE